MSRRLEIGGRFSRIAAIVALELAIVAAGGTAAAASPGALPSGASPKSAVIAPEVPEALRSAPDAVVHIVLQEMHPLPMGATPAQEHAFLSEVAAAEKRFRASIDTPGLTVLKERRWAHALVARVDARGLDALSRNPHVKYVYLDGEVHATLAEGVPLIGADQLHTAGYTGAGMAIAIVDTGVKYTHAALGGCFGAGCRVVAGYDFVNNDADPMDDNGHGTAVAGVAASDGTGAVSVGVAPGANLVALKVLNSGGSGSFTTIDSALSWVLTNRATYNIKVVNMSLGDGGQYSSSSSGPCGSSTTTTLVTNLVNVGVAVAVASGNDGYDNGVSFPACIAQATAVGGVYDANVGGISWCGATCQTILCTDSTTFADKFVCHTNAGPTLDVLAPDYATTTTGLNSELTTFGGTSAASPYVAGAFALMFDAQPGATVAAIEGNFKSTGVQVTNPGSGISYPRIDVAAAVVGYDSDLDGVADPNDNCPFTANPLQEDQDGDGLGDACDNCPSVYNDTQANADGDPAGDACDCDSSNSAIYPGAPEVCDGVNNNCDDPLWPSLYVETDDDGDGQAECAGDCDDANPLRFLGNPEVCDGIDNNCDGVVPNDEVDTDGDGYRVCDGDCNDGNAAQFPGNPEICDGLDNNCDGVIPADEFDSDGDGYMTCEGDCNDASAAQFPGNPEICDGLDNDCDGNVPADEADDDSDGFRICQGDCLDTDSAVYPGAPEVCDGKNNDCNSPVWPSLSVETDDDGDGFAECSGDCDDTNASIHPGATEICDDLDNNCDGSTDPGFPFTLNGNHLDTVHESVPAALDRFGASVIAIPDINSDGVQDLAIGATGWPSGAETLGTIYLLSGADRSGIRALTDPSGSSPAQMGFSITSPGDVNGDGIADIAGGAPEQVVSGGSTAQGRVVMFSGANGNRLWSYQKSTLPSNARLGTAVASIADLNSDGAKEIVAGTVIDCIGGLDCGGSVTFLDGNSGLVLRTVWDSTDTAGEKFGASIANLGDQDADGYDEIAIAAPLKNFTGATAGGAIRIVSSASGALVREIKDPTRAANDELGTSIASIADIDGDGYRDLVAGSPGRDTTAGVDAGQIVIFSGKTGALIRRVEDPNGAAGDNLGTVVAVIGDLNTDGFEDILAGVPAATTAAGAGAGKVIVFSGADGSVMATLEHDQPGAGDGFGASVAGVGPLDGDGRQEVAAGTPGDDGATGSDEGSLVLFSPYVVGDCDGDGIGNASDTCNDVDQDGAGNAIFLTPTCPLDCDDTNPYTYPGALDICDGIGNDCNAPGYPAPPADECFDTDGLTVSQVGSDLLFQWDVPAGGADGYNLYRGDISDLQAGTTGGYCFGSSTTNSLQVSDPTPIGTITYYVIAGVRSGVEGSRGRDFYGTERTPGDVCH